MCQLILLLIPKAKNKIPKMAGLLTYSRDWTPSRIQLSVISYQLSVFEDCLLLTVYCSLKKPVAKVLFNTFGVEPTAAGTVPEFDRIPFYLNNDDCFDTKIRCKSKKIF